MESNGIYGPFNHKRWPDSTNLLSPSILAVTQCLAHSVSSQTTGFLYWAMTPRDKWDVIEPAHRRNRRNRKKGRLRDKERKKHQWLSSAVSLLIYVNLTLQNISVDVFIHNMTQLKGYIRFSWKLVALTYKLLSIIIYYAPKDVCISLDCASQNLILFSLTGGKIWKWYVARMR